jgi:DNA (cytosine-5)-methyltransferase 1
MTAYYNENDHFAANWLRELIKQNLIAPGEVDERSIEDVTPADLAKFTQCHFFAGIGGWSYALRLAGWEYKGNITWTGSCPCQPFSAAGKGAGFADERHLWPAWFHLIRECRPDRIFGEQVASSMPWWDLVSSDLEGQGYACGAAVLGAHSVGAPHQRQRLYWMADTESVRRRQGEAGRLAIAGDMGDPDDTGLEGHRRFRKVDDPERRKEQNGQVSLPSLWGDADWLKCADGKARPVESGVKPLVNGFPKGMVRGGDSSEPINPQETAEARVMRLRGYGNAIIPQIAAEFIKASYQ